MHTDIKKTGRSTNNKEKLSINGADIQKDGNIQEEAESRKISQNY